MCVPIYIPSVLLDIFIFVLSLTIFYDEAIHETVTMVPGLVRHTGVTSGLSRKLVQTSYLKARWQSRERWRRKQRRGPLEEREHRTWHQKTRACDSSAN